MVLYELGNYLLGTLGVLGGMGRWGGFCPRGELSSGYNRRKRFLFIVDGFAQIVLFFSFFCFVICQGLAILDTTIHPAIL